MNAKENWGRNAISAMSVVALAAIGVLASPALVATQAQPQDQVTFTKDIAPILQRSCQNCHRPNALAPMSLMTYEEVRPWARSIKYRTGLRDKPDAMPPWFIDKSVGVQQYKDDISLNDEEVARIAAWVDSGAPRGNAADMPPPRIFADASKWQLGEPDLIVKAPEVEMPETAPDKWGPIGQVPTGLHEDRYISSVEMKEVNNLTERAGRQTIGGLFIVHHLHAGLAYPDGGSVRLPTHEVGRNGDVFDPEAGLLMKAGSILDLNVGSVHLHANGKQTKAHIEFGFRFHPNGYRPTRNAPLVTISTPELDIKGMARDQKFEAFRVVQENTKLVFFEPHMHATGVRMCLEAILASTIETITCSGYNHGWVRVYNYADDAAPLLPKGTILRVTGYFDNTTGNKNVADPRNWQGLGHRSMDNMMILITQGIPMSDEEFWREIARRREKLRLTEGHTVPGCPLCALGKTPQNSSNQ
jgi:mono/diheme cytochrome c family protein